MPPLLSLRSVSLAFGGEPLLDGVTLSISPGDRVGLVGRNGCGKSTLLKVVSGELAPDSGEVVRQPSLRVASLPQAVPEGLSGSVREIVLEGAADAAGAAAAVTRLGLDPEAGFPSLSGGQRRRCLLARALAAEPDILVLDEPTNHLDIPAVEWLEDYLGSRVPTFIFVTHDRAFLRRLARRIVDLDSGRLNGWDCGYDEFLRRRRQALDDEAAVHERLGKRLRKEEAWLRQGVKARATRSQGRLRALLELRARFAARRRGEGTGKFEIQACGRSGARAMRLRGLTFAYPGAGPVIRDFSLDILRGERIGVVGPNGCGKSTLVKLLAGRLRPTAGEVVPGAGLSVVYFDQLRQQLDPGLSVADSVADGHDTVWVGGRPRHVLAYLGDFLFPPERARTPVKALSGGERSRLLLARLFLNACNMLILDEPTNDLDAETLDLLEEQLAAFDGTVVLISHDRDFLDGVATSTLAFEDGAIRQYPGGYSDWRAAARRREAGEARGGVPPERRKEVAAPAAAPAAPKRLGYNERREYEALPARIEELEREEEELGARLSDPDAYKRPAADILAWQARLDAIPAEVEALMGRWAELADRA